jgi:small ligand-binding sensory domain FIST
VGSITNDRLGYEGYQVGVGAIASEGMHIDIFAEKGLDVRGEQAVGSALGRRIASTRYAGEPNLLLMYDMIKRPQVELNVATHLLDGIGEHLREWPNVAGVGVFGSMQFSAATQWEDNEVLSQSAIALMLSGGVHMDTIIMHGCRPAGRYYTVTKSDGARVQEIDGRPALDFIADLIPDRAWEEYPLFVTLGVNRGDQFGDFREEDYSNHLCMAIDREHGALVMFEPSLTAGTQVQLMRRSIDYDYIGVRVNTLFEQIGDRDPFFALYIDCAGRASAFCGSDREEADEVRRALSARNVPLLGMFSGVEIAKVGGYPRGLDWTGVLCVFSDPGPARSSGR